MVDGILNSNEEQLITTYANSVGLNFNDLPPQFNTGDLQKIGQAIILRNLQHGIMPNTPISVPVMLTKGEVALWVYDNVTMHQEKIQRETRGRHSGYSFRVCKGVTYRIDNLAESHWNIVILTKSVLAPWSSQLNIFSSTALRQV